MRATTAQSKGHAQLNPPNSLKASSPIRKGMTSI